MRKIESQMCAAVQSNIDWKSGNTEVTIDKETNTSSVYLHGNLIATVTDNDMTIYDGGWQTTTTKSRLNALCSEFCIAGEGVFQKDFTWYVRKFVGAINGQSKFVTETFNNGYIFAWRNHGEVSNTLLSLITSFFLIIMLSTFASMSSFEFAIAEVQNDLKVTRLAPVKPKKSLLTMTQTKGNRCRTNRTSGTNFVKQVWLITSLN